MKTKNQNGLFMVKVITFVCILAFSWPIAAHTQPEIDISIPEGCEFGTLPPLPQIPEQQILVCLPDPPVTFNGVLVLYAHGYVNPQEPLSLPFEELANFLPVVSTIMEEGFAFGTTSYSKNGYAIEQAGEDLDDLVKHFVDNLLPEGSLRKVLLTGASEGGIITTMLVEKFPDIYAGGLALCGPVGGMPYHIRYLGDFRVVFDYFFPNVFVDRNGEPFGIYDVPPTAIVDWETVYKPAIKALFETPSNQEKIEQLFKVTKVAADPEDPADTVRNLLEFSILGIRDLIETSGGGHPYGNIFRRYRGSNDDDALNAEVERVASDFIGRRYVRRFYQTTGKLDRPLVTLHTTLDDTVPFRHEIIYKIKVALQGRSHNLISIPVFRFGHCDFTPQEVLIAFLFLAFM